MGDSPDDPPYSIFGLPRVVQKLATILDWICRADRFTRPTGITPLSPATISAEDPDNDVYAILAEFTRRKRIHFAHVRNIKLMQDKDFYECARAYRVRLPGYVQSRCEGCMTETGFDGYLSPGSWSLYLGRGRDGRAMAALRPRPRRNPGRTLEALSKR